MKTTLRSLLLISLLLGTALSAMARCHEHRFFAAFNCNHDDIWTFISIAPNTMVPARLDLDIAGAGDSNLMRGPVVCITDNYFFALAMPPATSTGSGNVRLRDANGDVLTMSMGGLTMRTGSGKEHFAYFSGTYTVLGALSTGRYAGATGTGAISGWADSDLGGLPAPGSSGVGLASGQGFVEFKGSLTLAR